MQVMDDQYTTLVLTNWMSMVVNNNLDIHDLMI
jgi:hypothetical protein